MSDPCPPPPPTAFTSTLLILLVSLVVRLLSFKFIISFFFCFFSLHSILTRKSVTHRYTQLLYRDEINKTSSSGARTTAVSVSVSVCVCVCVSVGIWTNIWSNAALRPSTPCLRCICAFIKPDRRRLTVARCLGVTDGCASGLSCAAMSYCEN